MKKSDSLREHAEKVLQEAKANGNIPENVEELVHELQVHQIELEMQNNELRDSQMELSNLYEHYHELYNDAPVGYFSLDNNGNVRNVNIRGAELLGLEKDRIIGFGFVLFISRDYQTKYYRSLNDAVVRRKIQEVELQLKGKKSPFYVKMEIMPIPDKPDEKYRITITDITELKKAEEALHESEDKFRSLFDKSTDMITLSEISEDGLPGKYIEINEVGLKRLGYTREEMLNMGPADIVAPDKRVEMPKNVVEMDKKGFINFEIIHINKEGKKIPVEIYGHIINYQGQEVYLTVSRDVTERKQAEEQLKKLVEELERSNDELQRFAYISSHDLQEPLRTIASFTQLLERRYKGKFDSDADEFMDYIVDASIRMKQQIEGLLEYSRVATKGGEFEPVDMNLILNQTIKSLDISIKEAKADITINKIPNVMGDSGQLQRVFQNLISNAIKFRKPDEPLKIHISSNKDENNNEYIFSVKDNGIGIEEQYMERIFVIFQRLHTRDVYKGTGIGLSIVKKIIERHGGRIWVESEYNKGSTFYFTIPFNPKEVGGSFLK